jgi:RHS repeat-associated protein
VTDTYEMDTFGKPVSTTGSTPNPYRFGAAWGYITDPSGFLQLGARYYWPEIGRFITQDPTGDGMNWYAYAGDNPLAGVDPTGLMTLPWEKPENPLPRGLGNASNFFAGVGDAASKGLSRRIRAGMGPDPTDPCDPFYVNGTYLGGALFWAAAAAGAAEIVGLFHDSGGAEAGPPTFPETPDEMDDFLGTTGGPFQGTPRADKPGEWPVGTPGRGQVNWNVGGSEITYEQHPYLPGSKHAGPHWHVVIPGWGRQDYFPGDPIPGY